MADIYANIASTKVATSGTSIVFQELLTGIELGKGRGMIIDQIDYSLSENEIGRLADSDAIVMAWVTSNALTSLALNTKGVIDEVAYVRVDFGTAASAQILKTPIERKFDPPIIIAAPRIYLAAQAIAGSTYNLVSRIYFRYVDLKPQEYLEIAESFVLVG